MIRIYAQIDKRMVDDMPPALFDGRIITISTATQTDKAVDYLSRFPEIGIDTETRPIFHKGDSRKVSLLQIATSDTCFLFRLNMTGIPDSLASLLSDKKQLKIGLSLSDDIRALNQRRKLSFGRYIELQKSVRKIGVQDMSLQKIYANLFGRKISKSKRLTNWEAPTLSESQQRYAATDAWACLEIYHKLEKFRTGLQYQYIAPMDDERMFGIWSKKILEEVRNLSTHQSA